MRFVLEIDEFDNAAMEGNPALAVAEILRALPVARIANAYRERKLYGSDYGLKDVNGNTVGRYAFTDERPPVPCPTCGRGGYYAPTTEGK